MPLTRQEFLKAAKHRLDSQNRGGNVPVPARVFSLGALWKYAKILQPEEDIASKIKVVVGQAEPEAVLTM